MYCVVELIYYDLTALGLSLSPVNIFSFLQSLNATLIQIFLSLFLIHFEFYAFGRCFSSDQLLHVLHSSNTFYQYLDKTHDLSVANTMLFQLSSFSSIPSPTPYLLGHTFQQLFHQSLYSLTTRFSHPVDLFCRRETCSILSSLIHSSQSHILQNHPLPDQKTNPEPRIKLFNLIIHYPHQVQSGC